jgi:hypothetical protein
MKKWPNLFILGAMKCGTTSLHEYLAEHPSIEVSSDKEPHYFAGNPKAYDESGYLKLWRDNPAALYFCESSTNYSKLHLFPDAIEGIHERCKLPKFIYMVRNPIDRIESHYNHSVACSDETRSPEAVFQGDLNNNKYLRTSEYFAQIKPYCDTFGRENVLILDADLFRRQRQDILDQVFEFLELEAVPIANARVDYHKTSDLGKDRLFVKWIRRQPWLFRNLKALFSRGLLNCIAKKPLEIVRFSPALRASLYDHLHNDISDFEELSGLSLKHWHN